MKSPLLDKIAVPTLLLDADRCRANIQEMSDKAARSGTFFRPHFKTHQSLAIGQWFKEVGVTAITVSSLQMAEYFASEWDDVTVAFPVNILEIDRINSLAKKIKLNILVEHAESLSFLNEHLTASVGYFIKIDVGYGRTGLPPQAHQRMEELLTFASAGNLRFKGFLAHAGHTYSCRSEAAILAIHSQSCATMIVLKENYLSRFPELVISLGDTPSCSVAEDFAGIDEIRPGNFVFYDLTQARIGSNTTDQIAVAMACPVVARHPERNELVVYGGGVHLSKDRIDGEPEGTVFGRIVRSTEKGWGGLIEGMYLRSLSQEHGIVKGPSAEIEQYQIGDIVLVLSVHSCMAANAMKQYLTLEGQWIKRL
ncbi:alanine racemase [Lewinella cohaerens]|uniref:alanine racemase n=1 Tax=Lewinella cohaerens TaxID=70995 RepID=UPI00036C78B3|nr:alanine racemase [Lewinella cohaerens]